MHGSRLTVPVNQTSVTLAALTLVLGACGRIGFDSMEIVAITSSAGAQHTCVANDLGAVRCWGWGELGQLGYGATDNIGDDEVPRAAGDVNVGGRVVGLAAGDWHTCALLEGGRVRCWGASDYGQLGYGRGSETVGATSSITSAGDVAIGGNVIGISAGFFHTCALLDNGAVRCWGDQTNGQLGYGTPASVGLTETPESAGDVPLGGRAVQLVAGGTHTCALLDTGAVRCWGAGSDGELGYGIAKSTVGKFDTPASAGDVQVGGTVTQLIAGAYHTCALLEAGTVRCWGYGGDGQLGYGMTATVGDNETPESAGDVPVGASVAELVAGGRHTCALLTSGAVRCWGKGMAGELGYGDTRIIGDDESPAAAGDVPLGTQARVLGSGSEHTCAVLGGGALRCWGGNDKGQLGTGDTANIGDDESPASIRVLLPWR